MYNCLSKCCCNHWCKKKLSSSNPLSRSFLLLWINTKKRPVWAQIKKKHMHFKSYYLLYFSFVQQSFIWDLVRRCKFRFNRKTSSCASLLFFESMKQKVNNETWWGFFTPFSPIQCTSLFYLCFASQMAQLGFLPWFLSFYLPCDKYSC